MIDPHREIYLLGERKRRLEDRARAWSHREDQMKVIFEHWMIADLRQGEIRESLGIEHEYNIPIVIIYSLESDQASFTKEIGP